MTLSLNKPAIGSTNWGNDVNDNWTDIENSVNSLIPPGTSFNYYGSTEPSGWKFEDGQELDKKEYKTLYDVIGVTFGEGAGTTFTVDVANDEIDATAHGLSNNQIVTFTTTDTLPGGLSTDTNYYVINAAADTFQVSLTEGGSAVDITTSGSGTHSFHSGYLLPDTRGRISAGKDNMGGTPADRLTSTEADEIGGSLGSESHTLSTSEIPSHVHPVYYVQVAQSGSNMTVLASSGSSVNSGPAGGGGGHNNVQPTFICNKIIKT